MTSMCTVCDKLLYAVCRQTDKERKSLKEKSNPAADVISSTLADSRIKKK